MHNRNTLHLIILSSTLIILLLGTNNNNFISASPSVSTSSYIGTDGVISLCSRPVSSITINATWGWISTIDSYRDQSNVACTWTLNPPPSPSYDLFQAAGSGNVYSWYAKVLTPGPLTTNSLSSLPISVYQVSGYSLTNLQVMSNPNDLSSPWPDYLMDSNVANDSKVRRKSFLFCKPKIF